MSQPCILVAEDDPLNLRIIERVLEREGYVLLEASDGDSALQLSRRYKGQIDLLVSNADLPDMMAHNLVGAIRKDHPNIRVLIVSTEGDNDIFSSVHSSGEFLQPMSPQTLLEKVRGLLANSGFK